eukprot:scaffold37909_cov206-Amphora_coffeaeformis.AAC.1
MESPRNRIVVPFRVGRRNMLSGEYFRHPSRGMYDVRAHLWAFSTCHDCSQECAMFSKGQDKLENKGAVVAMDDDDDYDSTQFPS